MTKEVHLQLTDRQLSVLREARALAGHRPPRRYGSPVLARALGLSESTVQRTLGELRAAGLVPVQQQGCTLPVPLALWPPLPEDVRRSLGCEQQVPRGRNEDEWEGPPAVSSIDPPPRESARPFPEHISAASVGHPAGDLEARIRDLETELAELRRTNEWLTHSDAQEYRGGTFTLNLSDLHYHDKGHLLGTFRQLEEKVLVLLDRFQPRRVQILLNGDIVPGRGVYRNQMLEAVLPGAEQQVAAGAWRWREFREEIRAHVAADCDEEHVVVKGNHDTSEGEDTCLPFVLALRAMGIPARYVGTEWVLNLADQGYYHVLAEHGFGNSNYNPTSNKQILESYQKLIDYAQRGYVHERAIRRLLHGHTHWLTVGVTRAGVRYDTTGGGHRNDRANIGRNQRQPGWIVYVSPPGTADILTPLEVVPDASVLRADVDDPNLPERNRVEASRCLMAWHAWALEAGILGAEAA